MTVTKRLTQKVGPAPLWAWLVVGLAGTYLAYRHFRSPSSATLNSTPVAATSGTSGSDTGATGAASGSPLDQSGGDLLSSLLDNGNAYQQLLAALQGGIGSGGSGGAVGGVPASPGGGTSGTTAPTVTDTGVSPSLALNPGIATTDNTNPWAQPAIVSGGQTNADLPPDLQIEGLPPNAYVIGGPSQVAAPQPFGIDNTPDALSRYIANQQAPAVATVASPTPTMVAPAPTVAPTVYQPGTIVPRGTVQVE